MASTYMDRNGQVVTTYTWRPLPPGKVAPAAPAAGPPHSAKPTVFLNENLLRVKLLIQVVKPKPLK